MPEPTLAGQVRPADLSTPAEYPAMGEIAIQSRVPQQRHGEVLHRDRESEAIQAGVVALFAGC